MKERPIIFSGPMVRAIMEGRKTQTRRVAKYNPFLGEPSEWGDRAKNQEPEFVRIAGDYRRFCHYGQPGDRLWAKETYSLTQHGKPVYRADGKDRDGFQWAIEPGDPRSECLWKSPLFMPRWASRITLELVNVRVERVQDISESDVWEEGCAKPSGYFGCPGQAQGIYKQLWDSIHGSGSWAANPWAWVLEFKRINP